MAEQTQVLSQLSRDRLVEVANRLASGVQTARRSLKKIREASEDPLKMAGAIVTGAAGAALSGVIVGFTPPDHKFQHYDTVLGAAVALGSLAASGSYAGDLLIATGIGMYSPGLSRLVSAPIRTKRGG